MRAIAIASLAALSSATGCFPVVDTYLRPSSERAEYHQSTCAGWAGPHDRAVLLAPHDVMLGVEVYPTARSPDPPLGVTVLVYAPERPEVTVRVASRELVLVDASGAVHPAAELSAFELLGARVLIDGPAAARIHRAGGASVRELDVLAPMSGTGRRAWHGEPPVWFGRTLQQQPYYLVASFPGELPRPLRLRLPPLVIGGEVFQVPDLPLVEAHETWIAPMNC